MSKIKSRPRIKFVKILMSEVGGAALEGRGAVALSTQGSNNKSSGFEANNHKKGIFAQVKCFEHFLSEKEFWNWASTSSLGKSSINSFSLVSYWLSVPAVWEAECCRRNPLYNSLSTLYLTYTLLYFISLYLYFTIQLYYSPSTCGNLPEMVNYPDRGVLVLQ